MTNSLSNRLRQRLQNRRDSDLFRQRLKLDTRRGSIVTVDGQALINFCSNDYLGLSCEPRILSAFKAAVDKFGVGSSASPMVSGRNELHQQLELKLVEKTGYEAALIFTNGYMASLAVATTFAGVNDGIFLDRLAHASLIDASLLSPARLKRYQHADPCALQEALEAHDFDERLVFTDSIFSMDGDIAPLRELSDVCKRYQATLMVDDAHGFGVLGETGGGAIQESKLAAGEVPILLATFSKALGAAGAFVAASKEFIEALVQFGRSYIYATSLAPSLIAATLVALEISEKESWRRESLTNLIRHFRYGANRLGLNLLPSETAIQPIVIGDSKAALNISKELINRGFLITAIRPPTVPSGTARLRISLTAMHTVRQVDDLLMALGQLEPKMRKAI